MKTSVTKPLVFLCCALFVFSFTACSTTRTGVYIGERLEPKGVPPSHAPAHGYRSKHTYHYYPSAQVYFDISKKVYFYLEANSWRISASLPEDLRVRLGDYVTIEMDSGRPYTQFEVHKQKYPPGQLKKKKK